jgi:hypothetical protein
MNDGGPIRFDWRLLRTVRSGDNLPEATSRVTFEHLVEKSLLAFSVTA